jgi:hypothetical protein
MYQPRISNKALGQAVALCCTASLLCLTHVASATVTVYTSEPAFRAATSNLNVIDFNAVAPAGGYINFGSTVSFSNVVFNSYFPLYVVDPANAPVLFNYGTGGVMTAQRNILMTFPVGTNAVGTFVNTRLYKKDFFFVNLSTGDSFTFATNGGASNGFQFIGFVSTTGPITSMGLVTNLKNYLVIDNVEYGTAK